ncbi:hypothetical protein BDW74DRAFT_141474 [Aspergillus multicolor]|uniref:uncharacterized protein n=1 Tax=Aspergillus multicolor TaxID=41759 RepID=UPI003CCCA56D
MRCSSQCIVTYSPPLLSDAYISHSGIVDSVQDMFLDGKPQHKLVSDSTSHKWKIASPMRQHYLTICRARTQSICQNQMYGGVCSLV